MIPVIEILKSFLSVLDPASVIVAFLLLIVMHQLKTGFSKNIKLIDDLKYGAYLKNRDAFEKASNYIKNIIIQEKESKTVIDMKFTVVGMKYSWNPMIQPIRDWLKENENIHISLQILLVDPTYIEKLSISENPTNWADESKQKVKSMLALIDSLPEESRKRFVVEIRTYQSIPQYHGIIINNTRLFLGRTDWIFDRNREKPELTVGENRYRYFDSETHIGDERGRERIDLFLHWHKFYWNYFSEPTLVFENGDWKLNLRNVDLTINSIGNSH